MSVETFPRIVRFLSTDDAPGSQCPHCGAEGRFILRFQVEDGRTLGAMRGCVKLFPVAPIATAEAFLREKSARYATRGWSLNRIDSEALDACEAYYNVTGTAERALSLCTNAKRSNAARFRGR